MTYPAIKHLISKSNEWRMLFKRNVKVPMNRRWIEILCLNVRNVLRNERKLENKKELNKI